MDRRAVGQAGGGVSPVAENVQLLKLVAPLALPPQQKTDADLNICEKIRRGASLTPPALIDALCEDVPTRPICLKAAYVKEVQELASMLNRGHLLRFTADCR
jgi:hypothetical protein